MNATAELQSTRMATRREPRQRTVNIVEYSRYPRRLANEGRRIGYTQDRSVSGLGLDLSERVWPGELLQVTLRDIDGTVAVDGLARVVWCREAEGGRVHAGVSMLREKGQRPMMRVRHASARAGNQDPALGSH
jgi:hypothetical protein